MTKPPELTECDECGAAVIDRRRHRRWHNTVVVTRNTASFKPPYLGEEIGDISDAYVD